MSLNASAGEWRPNAAAQAWTPGGGASEPVAAPAPAAAEPEPEAAVAPPPAPAAEAAEPVEAAVDPEVAHEQAVDELEHTDYWTVAEDETIFDCMESGVTDFAAIAERLPGRSAEAVRERWTTELYAGEDEVPAAGEAEGEAEAKVAADGGEAEAEVEEAEEPEEVVEGDPREHMNLVFIGHVDAGKSTLSGNILYLTGHVDRRTVERFEKEAKERNRESWFLAFIMDVNEEERAKGKTVEVGRAPFETDNKRYTILDCPGHRNFIPNMIAGAAQSDVCVLVISARQGEFEAGFERGGQTREHALLAKTLGVQKLIVVVNKMDEATVNWSQERYDDIVGKLRPFLKSCGFAVKRDVQFMPISALTGAGVINDVDPAACPWYSGPTLLGALDVMQMSGRDASLALRMPVLDRFNDRGVQVLGKIEQGSIRPGDQICVMPVRQTMRVDTVYINELPVTFGKPGENVRLKVSGTTLDNVNKGFVVCPPSDPVPAVAAVGAQIALVDTLEHRPIFTAGYNAVFHAHTVEEECTITRIISVIDKKTGEKKRGVKFVRQGAVFNCTVRLQRSVCVETFEAMQHLGRFTLRDEGKTIAIGKILRVHTPEEVEAAEARDAAAAGGAAGASS